MPNRSKDVTPKDLAVAVIIGLAIGISDLIGLGKNTPEAIGFYTFCTAIIAAGLARHNR